MCWKRKISIMIDSLERKEKEKEKKNSWKIKRDSRGRCVLFWSSAHKLLPLFRSTSTTIGRGHPVFLSSEFSLPSTWLATRPDHLNFYFYVFCLCFFLFRNSLGVALANCSCWCLNCGVFKCAWIRPPPLFSLRFPIQRRRFNLKQK